MNLPGRLRWAAGLLCAASLACAQQGADVPYVRTPANVVDAMLDMAAVTRDDYLIDLGSGDGRISFAAAIDRGARSTGIELDPNLVDRKSTRLNSSHSQQSRMPSSA